MLTQIDTVDVDGSGIANIATSAHQRFVKRCVWLYFFLLIFEGGIRKWILPGMATPLLVIRDPVVILALYIAITYRLMPVSRLVIISIVWGLAGIVMAMLFGHGNATVAAYGARPFILHIPFIFLIGSIFQRSDVIRMGKVTLWITVPMVFLLALQFYSPQSAWVNRGVGGELEGSGFAGALGFHRASGTFSFTSGLTAFLGLSAAFIGYFWLDRTLLRNPLLLLATAALALAVPLSISRALTFSVLVTVLFILCVIGQQPRYLKQIIVSVLGIGFTVFILSFTTQFQHASGVLAARFEGASRVEGGLEGTIRTRYLGGLLRAISDADEQQVFGVGIGLGTNVGARLTTGRLDFLVAEGEWSRMVGELGPILGLPVLATRCLLAFGSLFVAYRLISQGDTLPWMIMSIAFLKILHGGWAQPTELGFVTITAGLAAASIATHTATYSYKSLQG